MSDFHDFLRLLNGFMQLFNQNQKRARKKSRTFLSFVINYRYSTTDEITWPYVMYFVV